MNKMRSLLARMSHSQLLWAILLSTVVGLWAAVAIPSSADPYRIGIGDMPSLKAVIEPISWFLVAILVILIINGTAMMRPRSGR